MSTYALTFITRRGGIAPQQHVGNKAFARGLIRLWATSVESGESEDGLPGPDHDRVCLLEVPSEPLRQRTTFRGQAFVFTLEEALRWTSGK